jgi:hypothetical protein
MSRAACFGDEGAEMKTSGGTDPTFRAGSYARDAGVTGSTTGPYSLRCR